MSNVIYVVPWAICDTESVYIKKVPADQVEELEVGTAAWDWCIKKVMANPDRRSKDKFAIIDVYNGYDAKKSEKGLSVFSLNNSADKLLEYGFEKATDTEAEFIKLKVLKLDKATKNAKKK